MKLPNTAAFAVLASFILSVTVPLTTFAQSPASVDLGTAGNYAILTKAGVSSTGQTSVVGDIGVSPVAASYITGFALLLPASSAFSTSALVTGKIYAPDYANPTPSNLTTAILDMQTAYTDAAGRAAGVTELGAGNIGGLTLVSGVYKWGTGVTVPTDVTLSGSANDVWIFQIAQGLNVASGAHIVLAGGAQAKNIFWVVAGQTTIGTTASFKGNILDKTAIVLNTGATLEGRVLAQTAVTLDGNAVTLPAGTTTVSVPAPVVPIPSPIVTATPTATTSSVSTTAVPSSSTASPSSTLPPTPTTTSSTVTTTTTGTGTSSSSSSAVQARTIGIDLRQGMKNTQVSILQQFLISRDSGNAARSLGAVGTTGYFGMLTRSALAEYQKAKGIRATGYFGSMTRASIASLN